MLELALESQAKSIALANDLALIVTADRKADLMRITNKNLKRINMWMQANEVSARKDRSIDDYRQKERKKSKLQDR